MLSEVSRDNSEYEKIRSEELNNNRGKIVQKKRSVKLLIAILPYKLNESRAVLFLAKNRE